MRRLMTNGMELKILFNSLLIKEQDADLEQNSILNLDTAQHLKVQEVVEVLSQRNIKLKKH
jgi:hypothetical protein